MILQIAVFVCCLYTCRSTVSGTTKFDYAWEQFADGDGPKLHSAAVSSHDNKIYIHGGIDSSGNYRSEMYTHDVTTNAWASYPSPQGVPLSARAGHTMSMYTNELGTHAVMFGGEKSGTSMSDTSSFMVSSCPPTTDTLPDSLRLARDGTQWCFTIKGQDNGIVWGDNPFYKWYTSLSTAAVHSGILAVGEVGSIIVEKVPMNLTEYVGTARNGITSFVTPMDSHPAFRLMYPGVCPTAVDTTTIGASPDAGFSFYHPGRSFVTKITGSSSGTLEGGDEFVPIQWATLGENANSSWPASNCHNLDITANTDSSSSDYCRGGPATDNFLELDLGTEYYVTNVQIYQRSGDEQLINPFEIWVGSVRMMYASDTASVITKSFNATGGRYVKIRLPGENRVISLAEVHVYAEPRKVQFTPRSVSLSSTMDANNASYPARVAAWCADGDSLSPNHYCATDIEDGAYFQMDFGVRRSPLEINIVSTTALGQYEVWLGDSQSSASPNTKCYNSGGETLSTVTIQCIGWGRYLRIVGTGTRRVVLLEVSVFGLAGDSRYRVFSGNTPFGRAATHNSILSSGSSDFVRVVNRGKLGFFSAVSVGGTSSTTQFSEQMHSYSISVVAPSVCSEITTSSIVGNRHYHTAIVDQMRGQLYVFGGWISAGSTITTNAVMALDFRTWTWYELPVTGTRPAVRAGHGAAWWQDQMIIMGGYAVGTYHNDLVTLNFGSRPAAWTTNLCTANCITNRNHFAYALIDNEFLVWGGRQTTTAVSVLSTFDLESRTWTTGCSYKPVSYGYISSAHDISNVSNTEDGCLAACRATKECAAFVREIGIASSTISTCILKSVVLPTGHPDLIASNQWQTYVSCPALNPVPRAYMGSTVYSTRSVPGGCPSSASLWVFGGDPVDRTGNETWKLTPPRRNYWIPNTTTQFHDGSFAGTFRDLQLALHPDACGNGIPAGGKVEITVPAAFTINRAESGGEKWSASVSNSFDCGVPPCLTTTVQLGAGNILTVDTGTNLLLNGGAEDAIDVNVATSPWKFDSTQNYQLWSQVTAMTHNLTSPVDSMFGYGWFQPYQSVANPASFNVLYQDVTTSLDTYAVGTMFYIRGFMAGTVADGKLSVQYYSDTSCSTSISTTDYSATSSDTGVGGWRHIAAESTKPTGARCARVRLHAKNDVSFDDIFFGVYELPNLNYGTNLFINVTGLKLPRNCMGQSSWTFGIKAFQYYDGDLMGTDFNNAMTLSSNAPCIDKCHACKLGEDSATGSKVFNCEWPSKDGTIIRWEREDIGTQTTSKSSCSKCSNAGESCYGWD